MAFYTVQNKQNKSQQAIKTFNIFSWVPQGSIIGPPLYFVQNWYNEDLVKLLSGVNENRLQCINTLSVKF